MDAVGEFVYGGTLTTQVEDTDLIMDISERPGTFCKLSYLRVRDTTVVPGLGVGLVLAVAIAAGGTATHFECLWNERFVSVIRARLQPSILFLASFRTESNGFGAARAATNLDGESRGERRWWPLRARTAFEAEAMATMSNTRAYCVGQLAPAADSVRLQSGSARYTSD